MNQKNNLTLEEFVNILEQDIFIKVTAQYEHRMWTVRAEKPTFHHKDRDVVIHSVYVEFDWNEDIPMYGFSPSYSTGVMLEISDSSKNAHTKLWEAMESEKDFKKYLLSILGEY